MSREGGEGPLARGSGHDRRDTGGGILVRARSPDSREPARGGVSRRCHVARAGGGGGGRGPTENRNLLSTIGVPQKSPTLFPKTCYHSCMSRHANTRSPSPPKRGRPEKASPMLHPQLAPGLKALVPQALAVLEDVLNRRKGDRVALTAAQWLVETVATRCRRRTLLRERRWV